MATQAPTPKDAPPRPDGLSRLRIRGDQRPDGRRRGWGLLVLLLTATAAVAAGGAWWYYRTTGANIAMVLGERPIEVAMMTVEDRDASARPVALVATGRIVSDRKVNVATKVSGQIVEMHVEQGDGVVEGQVLARIEDVIYRAERDAAVANVARQKHEIAKAGSEVARGKAAIVEARANLDFEQRNFERVERLWKAAQVSEIEFADAKSRYEAAAAALDVAKAAAEAAEAALQMSESQVAASEAGLRSVQKRLDDCAIRAPISGVVLERNAQVGDFLAAEGGRGANANAQLVSIADMSLLRVEIDIAERDVHRLRAGQPARVTPDADKSAPYAGSVMWIDPIGNYAKATVQVKVRIHDPGPNLRIEGTAKVEFLGDAPPSNASASGAPASAPAAHWLPIGAVKISQADGEATVFTVIDDRAVANRVTIGARTAQDIEVTGGVYAGMRIVADKADDLTDGTLVKPARAAGTRP